MFQVHPIAEVAPFASAIECGFRGKFRRTIRDRRVAIVQHEFDVTRSGKYPLLQPGRPEDIHLIHHIHRRKRVGSSTPLPCPRNRDNRDNRDGSHFSPRNMRVSLSLFLRGGWGIGTGNRDKRAELAANAFASATVSISSPSRKSSRN
jgi:hypothetical protein